MNDDERLREYVREVVDRAPPLTDSQRARLSRLLTVYRCDALARRGTGTGRCDRPLDESGRCDRPSDHLDE